MNLDQIRNALEEKFTEPCRNGAKRHIIFWYDEAGDFVQDVDELGLDQVKLWKLTGTNNFITKYTIDVLDPNSHYLVYSNLAKPEDAENWLLDMFLYSRTFTADKITMIMMDLKVEEQALRPVFKKYERFFNNRDRYARFADYHIENYTEEAIDLAVLAALAKQKTPNIEDIVRSLMMDSLQEDENTIWQIIKKYGDVNVFWTLVERAFGYIRAEKSLKGLFICFLITELSSSLKRDIPEAWGEFVSVKKPNCLVFLDHFMHHSLDSKVYDILADEMEKELHIRDYLGEWTLEEYCQVDLFRAVDRAIIIDIINSLLVGSEEFSRYRKIITDRKTKHFYKQFKDIYEALLWAIDMFAFKKNYPKGIPQKDSKAFLEAYAQEYFRMDQAYRKFCLCFDRVMDKDVLKQLSAEVENLYTNWFLEDLSVKWSGAVAGELTKSWPVPGIAQQQNFFRDVVQTALTDNKKAFVIISDGLRYEAAEELMQRLNTEIKGSTEITWMQGSLPSYTKLGMAALLPNNQISLQGEEIYIDGVCTKDTVGRKKVLETKVTESNVILLKDLIIMGRNELRDVFRGKSVVYIYHDVIDSTGDKSDETKTFRAVETAFEEIQVAIRNINKHLTEANIYITSDHGFIYRRKPLEESDKTGTGGVDPLMTNKRFLLFDREVNLPGTINIHLDYIFGRDSRLIATVPRGDNRFKTHGGGQNYVHGGASLQEVVIPLIKYRNYRKKDAGLMVTKVPVRLTSTTKKITNSIFSLEFFQTEKVAEKQVARSLSIYFIDEDGNKISNEHRLLADRTSDKPQQRTFRLSFSLKNRNYSRTAKYYLVLEDTEEMIERVYEKIPFEISLGIVNDYDF